MSALSQSDRDDLIWKQKTIRRAKYFKPDEALSFTQFMEAGGKRFDWPMWEVLVGPKPGAAVEKKKSKVSVSISERRKTA
jgi:hypothetical protein